MDVNDLLLITLLLVLGLQAVWIRYLIKKHHKTQSLIGRLEAKVSQHRILVAELRGLVEEEEDLDKCLREEVDGKAFERASEVRYEQNKAKWDGEHPESPWVPIKNPK